MEVPWRSLKCVHCSTFGHIDKVCQKKPLMAKAWVPKQKDVDAGKGEKKVQQEKDSKSEAVEKDHNVDSSSLGNKVAHSMMQNNIVKDDTRSKLDQRIGLLF